jgi:hypothetical protein
VEELYMSNELLPVPEWAKTTEAKDQLGAVTSTQMKFKPREFNRVPEYPEFFAEWMFRDNTFLVHLFPRAGESDQWDAGHYENRCRYCRGIVETQVDGTFTSCPKCGKAGLLYIPGRVESKAKTPFPVDIKQRVLAATDAVWMGAVAIDVVPELGAVAVQFQDVQDDPSYMDMLARFFTTLSSSLG